MLQVPRSHPEDPEFLFIKSETKGCFANLTQLVVQNHFQLFLSRLPPASDRCPNLSRTARPQPSHQPAPNCSAPNLRRANAQPNAENAESCKPVTGPLVARSRRRHATTAPRSAVAFGLVGAWRLRRLKCEFWQLQLRLVCQALITTPHRTRLGWGLIRF